MLFGPTLKNDTFLCFSDTQYQHFVQTNPLFQINLRLLSDQLLIQLEIMDLPLLDLLLIRLSLHALWPDQLCKVRL